MRLAQRLLPRRRNIRDGAGRWACLRRDASRSTCAGGLRHDQRRALLAAGCRRRALAGASASAQRRRAGDPVRKIVLISDPQGAAAAGLPGGAADRAGLAPARPRRRGPPDCRASSRARSSGTSASAGTPPCGAWSAGRSAAIPTSSSSTCSIPRPRRNGFNFVGYNNPEYDKLAEQQRQTVDPEARKKLIARTRRRWSTATSPTPSWSIPKTCRPSTGRSGTRTTIVDAERRRHPQLLDLHRRRADKARRRR